MAQIARVHFPAGKANREPAAADAPLLLWIDDFLPGLALYQAIFERHGFRVLTASSGAEGLRLAVSHCPDIVVTDYEMPGMDGEAVAIAMRHLSRGTPVVLFSGSTLVPPRVRRMVSAMCDKAGSRDQLLSTICSLLKKKPAPSLQPPPLPPASDERHRTVA